MESKYSEKHGMGEEKLEKVLPEDEFVLFSFSSLSGFEFLKVILVSFKQPDCSAFF